MAYFNLLISVPSAEFDIYLCNPGDGLKGSRITGISHLLSGLVKSEALASPLAKALDGGMEIHPNLWHPFRKPLYHTVDNVQSLAKQLSAEWHQISGSQAGGNGGTDPHAVEIRKVIESFQFAAERHELIVSALDAGPGVPPPGHYRFRLSR